MLIPWNWFKREEDRTLPVRHNDQVRYRYPIDRWYREMDALFENLFTMNAPALRKEGDKNAPSAFFRPSLDVSADDRNYSVTVELPGVEEKDLKVEVEKDMLHIFGEKKHESDNNKDANKGYYRIERSYGSFERMLALPEDVDAAAISAKFKDGVLTVTMPRKKDTEAEQNRKIAISKD
jgi:HSP20 family protein